MSQGMFRAALGRGGELKHRDLVNARGWDD
jgi:hypothetical protein